MANDTESEPFLPKYEEGNLHANDAQPAHSDHSRIHLFFSQTLTHLLVCFLTSLLCAALLHSLLKQRFHPLPPTKIPNPPTPSFSSIPSPPPQAHPFNPYERPSTLIVNATYTSCGSSPTEARELGCHYDILANHWLPSSCQDTLSLADYQADGTWHGYRDANHTSLIRTIEQMGSVEEWEEGGRKYYYTNMRDHILHCAMLWRRQYREFMTVMGRDYVGAEGVRGLDSLIVDEEHTMHCSTFLVEMTENGPDFEGMPIQVEVGYAGCHVMDRHEDL